MKRGYHGLAKLIEIIHLTVIPTYIFSAFAIFLSAAFRIHAAFFVATIYGSQKLAKGCVLTKLQNKLLKLSGKEPSDLIFIEHAVNKYISKNIKIPLKLINRTKFVLFLISAVVIFRYYF